MRQAAKLATATLTLGLLLSASTCPVQAQEEQCGVVHKQTREPLDGQRFWLLAEHGGKAFLDLRTCLVARLEVVDEPTTLSDAMQHCATLGQGGPYGEMGWQLPSMAELTSLDSELWGNHRGEFEQYKIPPLTRSETAFWTSTKWPGAADSWATVMFSGRTTLVLPLAQTMKAGVWCVQGVRATGLK
jgi:hypothetical protein